MTINNTLYFYQQLQQFGLDDVSIKHGTGLSLETLYKVANKKSYHLKEEKFALLLGFYCVVLCQRRQNYLIENKQVSVTVLERSQAPYLTANILDYFRQRYLYQKHKRLIITNDKKQVSYLTIREQSVLYYLLQNYKKSECANKLNIAIRTIDYHCERLCIRLKLIHYRQITQSWFVDMDEANTSV